MPTIPWRSPATYRQRVSSPAGDECSCASSRTRAFAAEMGRALGAADRVVVMDVYPAREALVPGVTGALVARTVPLGPADVVYEPDRVRAAEWLVSMSRPGDLVLTLGAGDVTEIGPQILERLA